MGRQSARIYFQGKDHKEVYFDGHYHDSMYLADSEGNATLVWEKLKGAVAGLVSMLSYVNGTYYAVVENPEYESMRAYSRPVLYEGKTLKTMRKAGYIWGEQQVRGAGYIMYADAGKLTVIRTNGSLTPGEMYVARIPLDDNRADMANVSYRTGEKEYYFSNFESFVYGNGINYYRARQKLWDPCIEKNGTDITHGERIGGTSGILPCGSSIVALPTQINASGADVFMAFFVLDDDNGILTLHKMDLSECTSHVTDSAFGYINEHYNMNDGWSHIDSVSVTAEKQDTGGRYAGFVMVSENVGYITLRMTAEIKFTASASVHTLSWSEIHRIRIDFRNLNMLGFNIEEEHTGYNIYSQIMDETYRVQIVQIGSSLGEYAITYGRVGQDYKEDVRVSVYMPVSLGDVKLTCLAHCDSKLTAGISGILGKFVVIDTVNNTAEFEEITIREE